MKIMSFGKSVPSDGRVNIVHMRKAPFRRALADQPQP
jgi:hypothetical protein